MPTSTPWGTAQTETQITPGITWFSTASHGGFRLDGDMWREFHLRFPEAVLWAGNPWFEEDCDWAWVPIAFPEFFSDDKIAYAVDMVMTYGRMASARTYVARNPVITAAVSRFNSARGEQPRYESDLTANEIDLPDTYQGL